MNDQSDLSIVYHHDGILVVDKPFGLASQPTKTNSPNVYDILKDHHQYIGLHHRLDQPASGLLLLCTSAKWNKAMSKAFQQHEIFRIYTSWVLGNPGKSGEWKQKIDGKPAHSEFQQLYTDGKQSVLQIKIQTGRKHQIRRQAAAAGHPILGDKRYGGIAGQLWTRLALHASKIQFLHPGSGEQISITSSLPKDLHGILGESITSRIQQKI